LPPSIFAQARRAGPPTKNDRRAADTDIGAELCCKPAAENLERDEFKFAKCYSLCSCFSQQFMKCYLNTIACIFQPPPPPEVRMRVETLRWKPRSMETFIKATSALKFRSTNIVRIEDAADDHRAIPCRSAARYRK